MSTAVPPVHHPSFRRAALQPLLGLLLICHAVAASGPAGDVIHEEWTRVLVAGAAAGYTHTIVQQLPDDTSTTWVETRLRLARMGTALTLTTEQTWTEDVEGRLQVMVLRSQMPGTRLTTATVDGEVLRVSIEDEAGTRHVELAWEPGCRGPEYWRRALRAWLPGRKVGERFESTTFDLELSDAVVSTQEILERVADTVRVRSSIDKLPGMPQELLLDAHGDTISLSMDLMGATFVAETCTRTEALAAFSEDGLPPEVFAETVLRPDRAIPRPRGLDRAIYRLRARNPAIPLPDFAGPTQRVLERAPGELVLEIRRVVPGAASRPDLQEAAPGETARGPSATIESDAPEVVALAARLAGDATDAWTVARRLERGVYEYIDKRSLGVAFATAREVCRDRSGDCTEHAVLLAAVCRARGLPSRVAMGLEYLGGIFGGHAWTEVWIDGEWIALDATLGMGSVDATHLRFAVSDLAGMGFGTEMFAALLGLGNLEIDVLETEHGGRIVHYEEAPAAASSVDGLRLHSHDYGIVVEAPAAFAWDAAPQHWTSGLIARATEPEGRVLAVSAEAVSYDFGPEDLAGDGLPGRSVVRVDVDGRPAVVRQADAWSLFVLDGDTRFELALSGESDEDLALEMLITVASRIRFDRR